MHRCKSKIAIVLKSFILFSNLFNTNGTFLCIPFKVYNSIGSKLQDDAKNIGDIK